MQSDDTAAEEFTETNPEVEVQGFVGDERFAWSSSSKAPWVPLGPGKVFLPATIVDDCLCLSLEKTHLDFLL